MKRDVIEVLMNEMSFMRMKLVCTFPTLGRLENKDMKPLVRLA
jgi:hypothetical protein